MTGGLRWGIIATGHIARQFAGDLAAFGLEAGAVGSSSLEKAQAFAAELGIPRAYGSYEELVADPDIEVVYIGTPHPFHAPNALLALRAGKHVLIEKPMAMSRAEAEEVLAEARSRNLLVQEALWARFLPHMVRLRSVLDSGVLGSVRTVIAQHAQRLSSDPSHRMQDPALGGGALLDLGIYPISFAWDVLGEPSRVSAISTPTATGVDALTSVLLGWPDGEQAMLSFQLDAAGWNGAVIVGTEARVELDGLFFAPTRFRVIASDGTVLEEWDEGVIGTGLGYQALAVEQAILEGRSRTDELPAEESARILGTLDEIRAQIGLRYPGEA
jgi:predicted dehydrogenase